MFFLHNKLRCHRCRNAFLITFSWSNTLKAHKKPNACVQVPDTMYPGFFGAEMWNANTLISEDCLYLNIAVPVPHPNNSAVLVSATQEMLDTFE